MTISFCFFILLAIFVAAEAFVSAPNRQQRTKLFMEVEAVEAGEFDARILQSKVAPFSNIEIYSSYILQLYSYVVIEFYA